MPHARTATAGTLATVFVLGVAGWLLTHPEAVAPVSFDLPPAVRTALGFVAILAGGGAVWMLVGALRERMVGTSDYIPRARRGPGRRSDNADG